MDYRFFLNDLEIDQPIGWDTLQLSMKRDAKYHGIIFEATTSSLGFYGEGALYLEQQKTLYTISANVIFRAEVSCADNPYGDFQEIYRGRLNFGKYKDTCGNTCTVTIPAEEDSCQVVFKSKFDQEVDLDSRFAFDRVTGLTPYVFLGHEITLPAKAIEVGTVGSVIEGGNVINANVTIGGYWIGRPTYGVVENNSIQTGQLDAPSSDNEWSLDDFAFPITPQLLFEDIIDCFPGTFEYNFRFAGNLLLTAPDEPFLIQDIKLKVVQWDGEGTIFADAVLIQEVILPYTGVTGNNLFVAFDEVLSGTMTIPDGVGVYGFMEIAFSIPDDLFINLTYNPNTSISITATKLCPDTQVEAYLVHETISQIAEAITNRCIRGKSEYYGRIDSQPFAFPSDGCGGLRMVTNGLKIRRAPEDTFFLSMKTLIEGLNAIDNIGFDIIPDPDIPGKAILRVEPVEFFYRDDELLSFDFIPKVDSLVQEAMHYSRITAGYKKWEVEEVNGLGEPNSGRIYRTSVDTISTNLDISCGLVAGSYAIEVTRQQSFAETGAADTKYDNDTFIICLARDAYNFHVERGNITNAVNLFDPDTIMNFRITPVRNLLRWYPSIINTYPNANSSAFKLFFSSGTGNFSAAGELTDDECRLENGVLAENQDLFYPVFKFPEDAVPIWKNETATFDYPLSLADYLYLKANPYGYISIQCGKGAYQKAFIDEILFTLDKGKATFTLRKKW